MDVRDQALQLLGCADQEADKINAKGYWEFDEYLKPEIWGGEPPLRTVRQSVCIANTDVAHTVSTFHITDLTACS